MNLDLKELQVIREGLQCTSLASDRDAVTSATKKVDEELKKLGYKLVIKAFYQEWKRIGEGKTK